MSTFGDETRWLDATEQAKLVRSGQLTAAELLDATIERIEAIDPAINAVVMRWFDHARATVARTLPDGIFRGVPFLLKDLVAAYAGQPLSNGNRRLKEAARPSAVDTTLVARFRAAGLVTAGRTNTSEFGSLPATESRAWGPTRNPWSAAHSPGGSSGGSAAAVAAGMVAIAHASDGGGSIRIPASCCGVVGLKPTQGRVTAGPAGDEHGLGVELCVSRTVRDIAAMLDAVHGPGVGDTVIAPPPSRPYVRELDGDPGALRIGLLAHRPLGAPVHQECATAVHDAGGLLESLGHHVEWGFPAALADPEIGRHTGVLRTTRMAVVLSRLEESLGYAVSADDVEPFDWAQAEQARAATALDHARALAACVTFRRAVQQWWADGFDLLVTPTIGELPAPLGAFAQGQGDPTATRTLSGRFVSFTQPFNVTGQPAISLPLHQSADGLPVGVQFIAAYGRDDLLIRVAAQIERARPWSHRMPPLG